MLFMLLCLWTWFKTAHSQIVGDSTLPNNVANIKILFRIASKRAQNEEAAIVYWYYVLDIQQMTLA